jgi:hypothetical protein
MMAVWMDGVDAVGNFVVGLMMMVVVQALDVDGAREQLVRTSCSSSVL